MKAIQTWILVADGARARLFLNQGPGKGLESLGERVFPTARKPTREMGTDRPGRVQESANAARHSLTPRVDWHEFEKEKFAREVAAALDRAALNKLFDRLIIVAPPKTLGELRAHLSDHAKNKITAELDKDLTHCTVHELPQHLEAVLAV